MDRIDRMKRLDEILAARRTPAPMAVLCEELDCSERSVHRVIADLRDRFGMPIEHADGRGYYLDISAQDAPHRLPDLWFTAEELEALLILQRHLENLEPGLLADRLGPARQRIEHLLQDRRPGLAGLADRVRFIAIGQRRATPRHFATIAEALIQRQALHIAYRARSSEARTERTIDPQRLVHYRDVWYLDAWCRWREDLRTFSLDRIETCALDHEPAVDITPDHLDAHYASAYGIFAGEPTGTAVLRFTPKGARWAAAVEWHPEQEAQWLTTGEYELCVPYRLG
jgi:predicted DNA-binding transcriptional regulator YafY